MSLQSFNGSSLVTAGLRVGVGGLGGSRLGVQLLLVLLSLGVGLPVSSGGVLVLGLGAVHDLLSVVLLLVDELGLLSPELLGKGSGLREVFKVGLCGAGLVYLEAMVVVSDEGVVVDHFLSFQVEPHLPGLMQPAG